MVEVGIFRKELHEMEMKNSGFSQEQIDRYAWVELADGHEAVFDDSNAVMGMVSVVNVHGNLVELFVLREWCNDFKPLTDF